MSKTREMVHRALAIAQVPRVRHRDFLEAYRRGGLEAVRALDGRVADALGLELRYAKLGLKLDTKGQHARELSEANDGA